MPLEEKIFEKKAMEIAKFILKTILQKGMKQKELAERMGKTEAEVSKLLNGSHNYTLRSIAKIEAALDAEIITIYHAQNRRIQFGSVVKHTDAKEQKEKVSKVQMRYGKVIDMFKTKENEEKKVAIS
jgi:transcriptional regulator with XRE-family HTH domain